MRGKTKHQSERRREQCSDLSGPSQAGDTQKAALDMTKEKTHLVAEGIAL